MKIKLPKRGRKSAFLQSGHVRDQARRERREVTVIVGYAIAVLVSYTLFWRARFPRLPR